MMPQTLKRRKKARVIFVTIVTCSIIGMIVLNTPIWNINVIDIEGNLYYNNEEIMNQAEIFKKMHILKINKKRSIKELQKLPYIHLAEINVKYPSSVKIKVIEREPIGYVPFSGTYLSIDKMGQVLDQREAKELNDLPIVEGLKFDKFVLGEPLDVENEDSIMAIIEMTTLMEKYNLLDKAVKVDVENLGRIHLYINSLDVIIGEISDLDKKIQWLCEIMDQYKMGVLDLSNIDKGQAVMSPLM